MSVCVFVSLCLGVCVCLCECECECVCVCESVCAECVHWLCACFSIIKVSLSDSSADRQM